MLRITNMLGRLSAGPANNNANAGPLPIPAPCKPPTTGISVKVAKYIKAPASEAQNVANTPSPPTAEAIHCSGIQPSWPGRPSRKPATRTPASSSGTICLV